MQQVSSDGDGKKIFKTSFHGEYDDQYYPYAICNQFPHFYGHLTAVMK